MQKGWQRFFLFVLLMSLLPFLVALHAFLRPTLFIPVQRTAFFTLFKPQSFLFWRSVLSGFGICRISLFTLSFSCSLLYPFSLWWFWRVWNREFETKTGKSLHFFFSDLFRASVQTKAYTRKSVCVSPLFVSSTAISQPQTHCIDICSPTAKHFAAFHHL